MDELSSIAAELKVETNERKRNKLFLRLRSGMASIINKIKGEFSKKNLSRIDFDQVVDLVLYQSLESFDPNKGQITYHAYRFIREYIKREIIKASHIKVPILVAKKHYKICDDDRPMFLDSTHKDYLKDKYSLTDSMYQSLVKVHRNVGKRYLTSIDSIPVDYDMDGSDIEEYFSRMEPRHERFMRMHYGFDGQNWSLESCAKTFRMTLEEVEEMHQDCICELKSVMENL